MGNERLLRRIFEVDQLRGDFDLPSNQHSKRGIDAFPYLDSWHDQANLPSPIDAHKSAWSRVGVAPVGQRAQAQHHALSDGVATDEIIALKFTVVQRLHAMMDHDRSPGFTT